MRRRVLILGTGDMGSAVAHALHGAGVAVALQDDPAPAHPRSGMAFADALWDGAAELAGLRAVRADDAPSLRTILVERHAVAVTALPLDAVLVAVAFDAVVDASMRKRATPPDRRGLVPLAIGLGPGFVAGGNCDLAVETSWEDLGRIVRDGPTLPLRGEPRAIAGIGSERAVYAPAPGVFRTSRHIGERVAAGEALADLDEHALRAPIAGALRGLVRDGVRVVAGVKVIEVDPRGDTSLCRGLGERPRRVAEAVKALVVAAIAPAASGPIHPAGHERTHA